MEQNLMLILLLVAVLNEEAENRTTALSLNRLWLPTDSAIERQLVSVLARMLKCALTNETKDCTPEQLSFDVLEHIPTKRESSANKLRKRVKEVIGGRKKRKVKGVKGVEQLRLF